MKKNFPDSGRFFIFDKTAEMKSSIILLVVICLTTFSACLKEKGKLPGPGKMDDAKLLAMAKDTNSLFVWKNASNQEIFNSQSGAHTGNYRMFLNAKAKAACTNNGYLPANGTFPDSSLIVKVLRSQQWYAVMYKQSGQWQWAEYSFSGNTIHSMFSSSSLCVSCHAQAYPQFDYCATMLYW